MDARFGGEDHHFYAMSTADLRAVGKRSLEWDLNEWKWDGHLFMASPLNLVPSGSMDQQFFTLESGIPPTGGTSNSSSSCSDEVNLGIEKMKRELEKRRRVNLLEEGNLNDVEAGTLVLKLGGQGYQVPDREVGNWEGMSGKKTKLVGGTSNRAICQVDSCGADLSNAKDYHRRHKVCEMHSKASKALVGNIMQRFCQQCSRFHALQEFDEGKRSCRRRLAGHNKRRRKTNADTVVNGSTLTDDQTNGYLLISLLRILSNMHSNQSNQATDQDLLSHLLRSLASQSGEHAGKNISAIMQDPPSLLTAPNSTNAGNSHGNSELVSTLLSNGTEAPLRPPKQHHSIPVSEIPRRGQSVDDARSEGIHTVSSSKPCILNSPPAYSEVGDGTPRQIKTNNFDLNDIYIDSDGMEDIERSPVPANMGTSSLDSHQSSPPQTSGHSDSVSTQSPASSSGDAQSRTDRIVFKLFGKQPSDFPLVLRAQILEWLSHSPTDIESYIRPGCIILTIYLRLPEAAWQELCHDLSSSLKRLLDVSNDSFWRTGWVYIRVQHQIAFVYNGQVVIDTSLPLRNNNYGKIVSVKPIAISAASERAQFLVKGINLTRPATRLLCALEGNYLVKEDTHDSMDTFHNFAEHDEHQSIHFSCSIPAVSGRGFIELEDHGFSSSFFPFIVTEEDVCSEIRALESALELTGTNSDFEGIGMEAKNQALDFIHEMGWLLHRNQLKSRLGHLNPNADLFPLKRFKWLMEFSMDRDWCSVVRKLLDILLDGTVGAGEHTSLNLALAEMALLHRAVRRNSRALVELLVRYQVSDKSRSKNMALFGSGNASFLFRPDVLGPGGLTPIHIAAGKDGSENVLDALTDDPKMVGIEAWKGAHDSTGATPEDYARLRGHYSYIHLVQKKINKRSAGHLVLDIPNVLPYCSANQKQHNELVASFEIGTELRHIQQQCKLCDQKLSHRMACRSLVYRPVMLSMITIAAVCVCVALLFKSSPEVLYVFRPFRWEQLDCGTS